MRKKLAITVVTVAAMSLTACGSAAKSATSSNEQSQSAKPAAGADITLGVLTSLTGAGSSGFLTLEKGVKARIGEVNAQGGVDGHKINYVMADDTSSVQGAITATKKLIEQDKVYGIIDDSSFFSEQAANVTKAAGIPVTASTYGGAYWQDPAYGNLFDALGKTNYALVATTFGQYFKSQGATKVAAVAYANQASTEAANGVIASSIAAGLTKAYVKTTVPIGSTDVGPVVLGIKASGADALYLPLLPSTAFAIVQGLKQAGASIKTILLPTGYGGDLLQSKPTVAAAEGVEFNSTATPTEVGTEGTKAFQNALATYAGETSEPTFAEYLGWLTTDLFIHGLQTAGPEASRANFISKLRASTWDSAGLMKPIDFAHPQLNAANLGPDNCTNVVKLIGGKFVPVTGATPVCGTLIAGQKVG